MTCHPVDPRPVVILTGASSGIGRAAARLFAVEGARLVLAARRTDALEDLRAELVRAGAEVVVVPTDLADLAQAEALAARALEAFGRVDVLVNNAGFGWQGRFEAMDGPALARMFAVNVLAPMALARAVVPAMVRQGAGSIVNVASVGGVVAHPLNVAYCASKHALVGFSKALRLELRGTGIRVVAVCPGATRTEFFERATADVPFTPLIARHQVGPEVVARAVLRATRSRAAVAFPTWAAWFLHFADRWLPGLSDAGNLRYRDEALRLARDGGRSERIGETHTRNASG